MTNIPRISLEYRSKNIWFKKGENIFISILTSAEATCLAMVNIRLSVISHAESTLS